MDKLGKAIDMIVRFGQVQLGNDSQLEIAKQFEAGAGSFAVNCFQGTNGQQKIPPSDVMKYVTKSFTIEVVSTLTPTPEGPVVKSVAICNSGGTPKEKELLKAWAQDRVDRFAAGWAGRIVKNCGKSKVQLRGSGKIPYILE